MCSLLLLWQMYRCREVDRLLSCSQLLVGLCLDRLAPNMVRDYLSLVMYMLALGMSWNRLTQGMLWDGLTLGRW